MNRFCYRVIFNRVRGAFMAVQESAGRRATGAPGGIGSALTYAAVTTVAVACAFLCASIATAQIVADPNAARGQQPTVLAAPNGVPVVNIVTPSAAGVSHNTYRQFDVATPGAILNNSRGNVQTQLGGWVQGNPWLAQGSARVILNEVNSTNPSLLHGAIEVAGPRTEVIIANPAGISIDGGGFINTSRITLTTGSPVMNAGNLESYRVQRGSIAIEGRGLDAGSTDSATLLARAIQVNAGIWAQDLRVVAGAHQASADGTAVTPIAGTGPAPAFLLDVADIGGMYAGHIFLVGTEAGLGVRNAGNITASGALTLSADGRLTNSGTLQSGTDISLQAGTLDNSGTIAARAGLNVAMLGDITNNGGTLEAGTLTVNSLAGDIDNRHGTLRQTSAATLDLTALEISNTEAGLIGTAPALATATTPPTTTTEPGEVGTGTPVVPVAPPVTGDGGNPVLPSVTPPVAPPARGSVAASGHLRNDAGRIETGGAIAVSTSSLNNNGGALHADRVALAGPAFTNVAGTLTATESFAAAVVDFDNSGGNLQTTKLAVTSSGDLHNQGGTLSASGPATLAAGGAIDNREGHITSGADLSVQAASLDNTGSVRATRNLRLELSDNLRNQAQGSLTAGQNLSITAGSLNSGASATIGAGVLADGKRAATGDLAVTTTGALAAHGQATAVGRLDLAGASLDLSDGQASATNMSLAATQGGAITRNANVSAGGTLSITSLGMLDNSGGVLAATGNVDLHTATLNNQDGTIAAVGPSAAVRIDSAAIDNDAGLIQSAGALVINTHGHTLANTQAEARTAGPGGIVAGSTLNIGSGSLDNTGGFIASQGDAGLNIAGLTNREGGQILSQAALAVTSQGALVDNRGGQLQAAGDLTLLAAATDTFDNRGGLVRSASTARLDVGNIDNSATLGTNQGVEATNIRITAAAMDNRLGAVRAGTDSSITVSGELDNRQGLLSAGRDLSLGSPADARSVVLRNAAGRLQANRDLQVSAAEFDGQGALAAGRDLTIAVVGDITHRADITAVGNLRYSTEGSFTNQVLLQAGHNLSLSARDIDNQAAAEISAGNVTAITATGPGSGTDIPGTTGTFTNRGLVDGATTRITAGTLRNLGTGRIYGNHVAVSADTLENASETVAGRTQAGTIAARQRLDIAAVNLANRDGALLFSAGDLAIGGALDANGRATGRAGSVTNSAADIQALGKLSLVAGRLDNLNVGFATHQASSTEAVNARYIYLDLNLQGRRYTIDELGRCRACASDHDDPGYTDLARLEYVAPSAQYPFEAGYARHPYLGDGEYDNGRPTVDVNGFVVVGDLQRKYYAADDPVWALFDVPYGQSFELNQKLYAYNLDFMNRAHRDFTTVNVSERTVTETVVDNAGVAGRIRSSGDMALDIGSARNADSQIVAGGALDVTGGSLVNQATEGRRVVVDTGTWRKDSVSYVDYAVHEGSYGSGSYAATVEDHTTSLATGVIQEHAAAMLVGLPVPLTGPGEWTSVKPGYTHLPNADVVADDGQRTGSPPSVVDPATAPLPQGSLVRTATADIRLPAASLFTTHAQAGSRYLVETDPRFASYRQWLSSDYLLDALGIDPAGATKRLGDGFYEQQLVRQQITQLTGQATLGNHASDDAQYAALLSGAVTFAQTYQLRPGIALSPAQLTRLTSDIVWLVTQTVTLPDGSTQQVLVPQLYVHVQPGDLDGNGSLLAGNSVSLQLGGDATNLGGTIGSRDLVQITADNIANLGGRITGNAVAIKAVTDIDNIGGTIDAAKALVVDAGRDLNMRSTTSTSDITAGASNFSRTGVDRVAGLYLTGVANGVLVASAGRDANLVAAVVHNASAEGSTYITAKNDINLGVVQTGSGAVLADGRNISRESATDEVGSEIRAKGQVGLSAGNDVNLRGGIVNATGAVKVEAEHDVNIEAGQSTTHLDQKHTASSSGFLSGSTQTRADRVDTTTSVASSLGGATVAISAGRDIVVNGSDVVSDSGTVLVAKRDVSINAATNSRDESHSQHTTRTGLMSTGGTGVTAGTLDTRNSSDTFRTSAAASTIGSIGGDVTVVAGNRYTQTGSDISTPGGDIRVIAKSVAITEAREVTDSATRQATRQTGLTLAVTSPALAAIQSTAATAEAVGNTDSDRMKLLGVASAAMNLGALAGNLKDAATDPAAGASVSVSLGTSQSSTTTTSHSDTARGSSLSGKNVAIVAIGAGADSNLLIRGSDITASQGATLIADNDIDILAAQSTSEQHSTNSSSSASVGASAGTRGVAFTASANGARGHADGSDITQANSHVGGGERVSIRSGGDTTLEGAVVQADRVVADIGGNLHITSLQDTAKYDGRQQSAGGSISAGMGVVNGSVSVSQSRVKADYASVTEQSGIRAGDGGFDIKVNGDTDLAGAVIASTQKAVDEGKNVFQTASLTTRDIENREDFQASGFSLGGGYSADGTGKPSDGSQPGSVSGQGAVPNQAGGINGASAGIGSASGHQSSTTTSGVSGIAGNTEVRTGDGSNGLVKTFDADKVQKEIAAQVQITSTFGQQASKAIGEYSNAKYEELKNTDPVEAAKWGEGGVYRVAAHSLAAGLTGGLQGALGAASSQLAIDAIGKQIAATNLPLSVKTALVAAAGTAIGAAVGGEAGAAAGFNGTTNNYLSTADLRNRGQAVADCNGNSACVAAVQRVSQETTLANNAKVLDACMGSGGDCSGAINKAQQDRSDLQAYREALVAQQGEAADPASRAAIDSQIKQADAQIRSADTAIADGKLIQAGGNYSLAGLTAEERVAIGFALDPIGAAGAKVNSKGLVVINKPLGLGSTGRSVANNLSEQLAMKEVMSNPASGSVVFMRNGMTDARWPSSDGWVKMTQNVNGVEVHYVRNTNSGAVDDFKFKLR